jgi:lysophospholipase L1-like esterase
MIVSRRLPFPADLSFAASADFTETWIYATSTNPPTVAPTPVDLTGYSAVAIIYANLDDSAPLVEITNTAGAYGSIVLGGSAGTVQVNFTPTTTLALPSNALRWTLRLNAPDGTSTVFLVGAVERRPVGPLPPPPVFLVSIAVTPANATIQEGTPLQYAATGTYSDLHTADLTSAVTWASSSTVIATMAAGGLASGVGGGTASITATLGPVQGSTPLVVAGIVSIAVTPANATIPYLATQQYTAIATYSDLSTRDLTAIAIWLSSNTSVLTIAAGGIATAIAAGSCTVTATDPVSGMHGNTGATVSLEMPSGATLLFDASVSSSYTRGVYGALGTPEGQIVTTIANLGSAGGNGTQGTETQSPLFDEYGCVGQGSFVWGGNGDTLTAARWSTNVGLASIAYGTPSSGGVTFMIGGRFDVAGILAEFSAGIASNPGVLVTNTTGPTVGVKTGGAEQTADAHPAFPTASPLTIWGSAVLSWHRSDLGITTSGGVVTQWLDQSGNGRTRTPGAGGGPAYFPNGGDFNRPYLHAAQGTNVSLTGGAYTQAPPYCVLTVFNPDTTTGNNYLGDFGGVATLLQTAGFLISDGALTTDVLAGQSTIAAQYAPASPGDLSVELWTIGSVAQVGTTPAVGGTLGTPTMMNIAAGGQSAGGKYYEQVVLSRIPTAAELAEYVAYQGAYANVLAPPWDSDDTSHFMVIQTDGTDGGLEVWLDGQQLQIFTNTTAPGAGAITQPATIGSGHALTSPIVGATPLVASYPRYASANDRAVALAYYNSKWPIAPTTAAQTVAVTQVGDSTAFGTGVGGAPLYTLPGRVRAYGGPKYGTPQNLGVGGSRLVQVGGSGETPINTVLAGATLSSTTPNLVLVQGGLNDLGNESNAQIQADLTTVWTTAQTKCAATGLVNLVVVYTLTHNADPTDTAVVNAWIRANYASFTTTNAVFVLLDGGGDPMLSVVGAQDLHLYLVDDLHPSKLGYERAYGLLAPILAAHGF